MSEKTSYPSPKRPQLWAASIFVVVFLLPNLWAFVDPYETFPYTSAPMFAHYVGEDTPRYRFRFVAEQGGKETEIRATDLSLDGVEFTRYFFGHVYGSSDPDAPFAVAGEDTPADFEARLSAFFRNVQTVLERRDATQLSGLRLEVVRLDADNYDAEVRLIGHYDATTQRFSRTRGGAS